MWQAGGFPVEMPAMSLVRDVPEADDDDVPQLPGDGDRGAAALLPGRRRGADGRLRQDHAGAARWARSAWTCRRSSCRPGRCCAATGAARRSAPAPTPGSTGRSCAPATSPSSDWREIEDGIARSPGHCMTMGTASTMTSVAEALGLTLPGAASIPAADSSHAAHGRRRPGERIVEMVWEDLKPRDILTDGVVRQRDHRACMAHRRLDQRDHPPDRDGAAAPASRSTLDASTRSRAKTPLLANIRPSGEYLMEDFYYAGGLRALLDAHRATCCDLDCPHGQRHDARREHRRRARSSTTT